MAKVCFVCERRCNSLTEKEVSRFICPGDLELVLFMEQCARRNVSTGCEGMLMSRVITEIVRHPEYNSFLESPEGRKMAPLLNISYSRNRGEDRALRRVWQTLYCGNVLY
jgi:hypothetical protein